MIANMESLLERDFNIDVCLEKSSDLARYSVTYKNRARKFNRLQKKRLIIYGLIGVVVLIVLIVVILWIAGVFKKGN